ncbi:DMT family transporter [Temperatibacter marinus]|uniref:DMT family transporter n=1 Tax=Temperatibacter marinus TaxID=1456591 RepID=A0AA52EGB5_9PROT|nr:DMT family transporter [Temperatibacter marinus]WND01556.1 DMT family transporter [Temperatibacter marinus]
MKIKHILFVILLNAIWGWNFIAVKYSVADFTPFLSNMLRFLLAFVFMLPFIRHSIKGHVPSVLRIALMMGVLHFGCLYIATSMAGGVSAVAIAAQLNVPFATLCAVVMLKETVGLTRIVAIAVSFIGVIIMGFDPLVFDYFDALLVMTLGALTFAIASIYMRQLRDIPPMTIQAWVAFAGIFGSMALTLLFEDNQIENVLAGSSPAWWGIVFSGLLSTVVGHGGMNYLLQKYEVNVVVPYLLLMPFFAVSASIVMLGEVLTPRMIIGASCTILGVVVITYRNTRKMKKALIPGEET